MTTTTRTHGNLYSTTQDLDLAEVAKRIRSDLRAAVKAGDLAEATYSVKLARFSGGASIDVTVKNARIVVWTTGRDQWGHETSLYTGDAREVLAVVDGIVGAYNYDGSDSMTEHYDVRFYTNTSFDHATTLRAV